MKQHSIMTAGGHLKGADLTTPRKGEREDEHKKRRLILLIIAGLVLPLSIVLFIIGAASGRPPVTWAQPTDSYSVYYVAPSCTGVPAPCYTSVQAAVDAADDPADVIKIAEGIYTGVHLRAGVTQTVYLSKSVTLQGGYTTTNWTTPEPEAHPTILDAEGQGRVFYITGNISPTLEHLIIRHGDATGLGGGPWPYDGVGGGLYIVTATATISHCHIEQNIASRTGWGGGGGIYLWNSAARLENNEITLNTASQSASAPGEGGGIGMSGSHATLIGNNSFLNIANENRNSGCYDGLGGGIYMEAGASTLINNIISQNDASVSGCGGGGGIWFGLQDRSLLVNTALVYNFSGVTGKGDNLAVEWAYPRFLHTTLTGPDGGESVYAFLNSAITLTNSIVAYASTGLDVAANSTAILTGVLWYNYVNNTSGGGTITITQAMTRGPAFFDGYHLLFSSAAIDAGVDAGVTTDIDGETRPFGSGFDLGADEFTQVSHAVISDTGGALIYTDTQGMTTTVQVSAGAVTTTTLLVYRPLSIPEHAIPSDLSFAGRAFDLNAYRNLQLLPGFFFLQPVTITLHYTETDIAGIAEDSLKLYYWDAGTWQDAADSCTPASNYTRDLNQNVLNLPICHLSEYGMMGIPVGSGSQIYLPLVLRNAP